MKIGDKVGYKSTLRDEEFQHVGVVIEELPQGIYSCRMPMVKIEGKAGYVLASHCELVP